MKDFKEFIEDSAKPENRLAGVCPRFCHRPLPGQHPGLAAAADLHRLRLAGAELSCRTTEFQTQRCSHLPGIPIDGSDHG